MLWQATLLDIWGQKRVKDEKEEKEQLTQRAGCAELYFYLGTSSGRLLFLFSFRPLPCELGQLDFARDPEHLSAQLPVQEGTSSPPRRP